MDKKALKNRVCQVIEQRAERLIELGRRLQSCPEPGFREFETAKIVARELESLSIAPTEGVAVTGVTAKLKGRSSGFTLAIMGELDGLELPSHPKAHPVTGVAHACGHHAQLTMMLGAAAGLALSGVMESLDGNVALMAVPAEEGLDGSTLAAMREKGLIRLSSGKQEFIRLGVLDEVNAVFMTHSGNVPSRSYQLNCRWNGTCNLDISFRGKSSHAGLSPHTGVNALNAAVSAIVCLNGLRETFRDEDHVRLHFILSKGGDRRNIVPEETRLEIGVRAASFEANQDAVKKAVRAVRGAAYAMGCQAEIQFAYRYLPFAPHPDFEAIVAGEAAGLIGAENVDVSGRSYGSSTDAGDLAALMPTVHAKAGGYCGLPHTVEYDAQDEYMAYVVPAMVAACTAVEMLSDGAARGRAVADSFKPIFPDKEAYLRSFDELLENTGSDI